MSELNPIFRIVFFVFLLGVTGCEDKPSIQFYYDKPLEEIMTLAEETDSYFCLVLSDPGCIPCRGYDAVLKEELRNINQKVLINYVDVTMKDQRWYPFWLGSKATPAVCVFNSKAQLQGVIHGANPRCANCVKNVLSGEPNCAKYLVSHAVAPEIDYPEYLAVLNQVFHSKIALDKQNDIQQPIENSIETWSYPYNLYLKCLNELASHQNEEAKMTAYYLYASLQKKNYLLLYNALIDFSKKTMDPNYDPAREPVLSIDKPTYILGECKKNQTRSFAIEIKNTGVTDLEVYDVGMSCDCLEYAGEKEFNLKPQKAKTLSFAFTSTHEGAIERTITLTSNGIQPIQNVVVKATVK